jgi:amino acid permease
MYSGSKVTPRYTLIMCICILIIMYVHLLVNIRLHLCKNNTYVIQYIFIFTFLCIYTGSNVALRSEHRLHVYMYINNHYGHLLVNI